MEAGSVTDNPADVAISIPDPTGDEPGSNPRLCSTCQHEEEQTGASTSSFGARRKPLAIEVPRRNNEGFESESCDSPASQQFRSPMSRMLSFKRILSRDRRASVSPSAGCSGSVTQSDIESGRDATR